MAGSKIEKKNNIMYPFLFSICSIVNRQGEYELMKQSFQQAGFTESCEYLVADNTVTQTHDAYSAIRHFYATAQGRYLIIVHQDVRCIDKYSSLQNVITKLEEKDANWAVCGNAGCDGYESCFFYLKDPADKKLATNLPKKVYSLDENFLLINSQFKPPVSENLSGFHLYGTDLCLNAYAAKNNCYVIPFLVEHLSKGNMQSLREYMPVFLSEYQPRLTNRFVQTTCIKFYLGETPEETKRLNSPKNFGRIKFWERLKWIFKGRWL